MCQSPARCLTIEATYDLNDDKSHTAPSVTKTGNQLAGVRHLGRDLPALCRFCPGLAMRFSPYVRADGAASAEHAPPDLSIA
jgi:hypothetical protein